MQAMLAAMLPLVGVFVGAGLQYVFGRSMDVRRQVELSKTQAYTDYLRAFAAIATSGRSKETIAQLTDAKTRICVYGGPKVIRLLGDFERAGAVSAGDNMRLVASLVVAMREDAKVISSAPADADLGQILFGLNWNSAPSQ